ncbi:MAG: nitrate reductase subunit alpha [Chloroflexota bacterium]
MSWIKDLVNPSTRAWEDFYRNRWQYDKTVRSTHGVNCTGGCSWMVFVKDGIITWETQALDYPGINPTLPPYEPRGCQRGISFSWYIYSPLRVKYPYMRGTLLDLWRAAQERFPDPVEAWASIVEDETARASYQAARGKGGLRRVSWEEAVELVAASTIYTAKKWGPDRIVGFSPIPAMSMLSHASGTRFLQLLGGVSLSFYDWYADLPNAFPEVWGEQTDVCESADWFNSKYIVVMGANLNMTRTPDVHFVSEARHAGAKLVVLSPDFSQVSKYADWWLPVHAGQDGAFWMAVNHVILKEFFVDRQVPYFLDYLQRYTDCPFLVTLNQTADGFEPGRLLRASATERYQSEENPDFKYLVWDQLSGEPRLPKGTLGFRWSKEPGKWNLTKTDGKDDSPIEPLLSLLGVEDGVGLVRMSDFSGETQPLRGVPIKWLETPQGCVAVATIFDLLLAQHGVGRGLPGDYPANYDAEGPYTPAWQEKLTGIDRKTVACFAREFAGTAEMTEGKAMVIVGAGANHWYHSNLIYRSAITALMLCGCCGRNGGGMNHYVGQEKLVPVAPWASIAFATDWVKPARQQNAPSFHYMNSDQWRYERDFTEYHPLPADQPHARGHTADLQAMAARLGWLPCYPQFNRSSLELAREAEAAGAKTPQAVADWVVARLKERSLRFAMEDPDAPENWPRLFFIWRANALMSSAKGHELMLKHYLGTHSNAVASDVAEGSVQDVVYHPEAPRGKMDLVVDLNFRMDTSALYSDVILPAATWYEKNDLNSTDLHSYVHPMGQAVPPCWESKTDWEIFRVLAQRVEELAKTHMPDKVRDVVSVPLQHDTPDEMAQLDIKDWAKGECEPIPGKTMPSLLVAERDYANLHNHYVSLGPGVRAGQAIHGAHWDVADIYDGLAETQPGALWDGRVYPSLRDPVEAANAILRLAPETNGEVAYRAFQSEEKKVGLPLADLAEGNRGANYTFLDLVQQPKRILTSPCWSGIVNDGRAYTGYSLNVDRQVPWRTITGRQHFYLDHPLYLEFGEHLPTYKTRPGPFLMRELENSQGADSAALLVNILTPHGKWHMHTTYMDNLRMLTLSRGVEPCWLNDVDAELLGVADNDWVEVYNDNGVVVTRAVVSARIPRGIAIYYHAPERTISVPKSPLRGNRRAGGHNSLTRARLNPVLMAGGYGQFTYAINYWGPTGFNRDTFVYVRKLPRLDW